MKDFLCVAGARDIVSQMSDGVSKGWGLIRVELNDFLDLRLQMLPRRMQPSMYA
jgi:hypothetical protein